MSVATAHWESPQTEVQLLQDLVLRHSPSKQEKEAVGFLASWCEERGMRSHIDKAGNAIAEWGQGDRVICLLGHIDTVPGDLPIRVSGGFLTGRGTVDAKGPLASMAGALARLVASLAEPEHWKILLVGAVEEECETSWGAKYLLQSLGPVVPEFTIIGEPSGWNRITLGYRGCQRAQYRVQVENAHSASDHQTAAELAMLAWLEIQEKVRQYNGSRKDPSFDALSVTLLDFCSNDNGIEQEARLNLHFRLPPGLSPGNLCQMFAESGFDGLRFGPAQPAYVAQRNSPLVRGLLQSIRSAGGTPQFSLKTGTSDMNIVGPAWECPIVAYGPGDPNLSHTPEERVSLREYLTSIRVLETFLRKAVLE